MLEGTGEWTMNSGMRGRRIEPEKGGLKDTLLLKLVAMGMAIVRRKDEEEQLFRL